MLKGAVGVCPTLYASIFYLGQMMVKKREKMKKQTAKLLNFSFFFGDGPKNGKKRGGNMVTMVNSVRKKRSKLRIQGGAAKFAD